MEAGFQGCKRRGQLAASPMEALAVRAGKLKGKVLFGDSRSTSRNSEFMYWIDTEKKNLYTVYHRHKLLGSLDTHPRLVRMNNFWNILTSELSNLSYFHNLLYVILLIINWTILLYWLILCVLWRQERDPEGDYGSETVTPWPRETIKLWMKSDVILIRTYKVYWELLSSPVAM